MATQWMDDFQGYGSDGFGQVRMLNGAYAQASCNVVADPDPTAGGKMVLLAGPNANTIIRKTLSSPQTVVGVAFRSWLSALPSNSGQNHVLAAFTDVNNNYHGFLTLNASGYLLYYRCDSGTNVQVAISPNPVVVANAWRHIEIKVVLDVASGSVEVRLEGAQVLLVTGIRTSSNTVGAVASVQNINLLNSDFGGPSQYYKDFIIWDGTTSVNNTFFGSCQVYRLFTASDVSRNWNTTIGASPIQSPATTSTTGGTLAAATYYYVVTAIMTGPGESIASNEQSIVTTGTTSSNTITWAAPPGMTVTGYKIYRGTSAGTEGVYYTVGNVLTFTDTGAGSTAGTPPTDTGTGWNKLNETTPDDDGTFISAPTPAPAAYQALLTQLPNNVTTVRAVMPIHRSRKTDGGDGNIQCSLISGANTGSGANRTITTAYTYWFDMFDQDPSGVNWSKTLVNALKLKLDRTV